MEYVWDTFVATGFNNLNQWELRKIAGTYQCFIRVIGFYKYLCGIPIVRSPNMTDSVSRNILDFKIDLESRGFNCEPPKRYFKNENDENYGTTSVPFYLMVYYVPKKKGLRKRLIETFGHAVNIESEDNKKWEIRFPFEYVDNSKIEYLCNVFNIDYRVVYHWTQTYDDKNFYHKYLKNKNTGEIAFLERYDDPNISYIGKLMPDGSIENLSRLSPLEWEGPLGIECTLTKLREIWNTG